VLVGSKVLFSGTWQRIVLARLAFRDPMYSDDQNQQEGRYSDFLVHSLAFFYVEYFNDQ
jgi:hypothetical protein